MSFFEFRHKKHFGNNTLEQKKIYLLLNQQNMV